MKGGVPALNVIVSVLYILLSGSVAYWLKLSHKKRREFHQGSSQEVLSVMRKEVSFDRLFAVSWLKKYSLVGGCLNENRKYLVKQFFIMSVYAVTCLKINRIILWPSAFAMFLLPLSFVILEVAVGAIERKIIGFQQQRGKNQTVNNVNQNDIQIQAVNIGVNQVIKSQQEIEIFKQRSLVEVIAVSTFTFITFILFYQTIFTLTNSISNSGQLNITSLIIILLIDQLAIRVGLGLAIFAILKVLHRQEIINFSNNYFVNCLCHEEITKALIQLQRERVRKELQNTAQPLKHRQSNEELKPQVQNECESSENNAHLNLLNLQPQTLSHNNDHRQQEDDELQREIYLTTPQKQLFEGNQQESIHNRSILQTIIDNKQNQTVNNQLNKSTLKSHQESKGLQDIISSKDDPINDAQNLKTDFNLQNSRFDDFRNNKKGKKKARRVLKLTGNSPYLEYLPNMLKNIDKVKNAHKDKKML